MCVHVYVLCVCVSVSMCLCLCLCVHLQGITNPGGMIQCNIHHLWLIKQFLWFTLLSVALYDTFHDKMDGNGLINTACHEHLPKKTKECGTSYRRNIQH